jgi:hypothetical protein
MATYALTEKAVVLRPEDDVAVAKAELTASARNSLRRGSSARSCRRVAEAARGQD